MNLNGRVQKLEKSVLNPTNYGLRGYVVLDEDGNPFTNKDKEELDLANQLNVSITILQIEYIDHEVKNKRTNA